MKVKKTITEILQDQTITNQFDFTGSCPDKDGVSQTFTIFNTNFFLTEIESNYFNRVAFVDPDNSFTDFVNRFTRWASSRGAMYARLAYGYSLGYNPIENYSSIEKHTGHDDYENHKTITHTWSNDTLTRSYTNDNTQRTYNNDAVATTHANDKATTTYTNLKDATSKYGINSSNAVPVSDNTRTGSEATEYTGTKTDTHTGGYTDSHTGSNSDTHTGGYNDANTGTDKQIYDSTLTKSGNIGVMTPSQMLMSEYDGLKMDLPLRALFDFLDRCTFYSEGVDII